MKRDSFETLFKRRLEFSVGLMLSTHCSIERMPEYGIDEDRILKIFKEGKLYLEKCERPDKIGIALYDGKRGVSQVIIVRFFEDFAKVVTVWEQKGRL